MKQQFIRGLSAQAKLWRAGALPGLVVMTCIIIARLSGALQVLEWMAFDHILRSRPLEAVESNIVIVGINEADIKATGTYPIPDGTMAKLLETLQGYQPTAIGLDIFRDVNTGADRAELAKVLSRSSNIIGIECALGTDSRLQVSPPPELPPEQIGLADVVIDDDGKLRRSLLASKVDGRTRYSVPLLLSGMYLNSKGIAFQHGQRASEPIQFDRLVFPRFRRDTGGYSDAQAGGNQILLNFHNHPHPFRVFSMTDVLNNKVAPSLIRDRIVLIGMTAASVNDTFMTTATQGTLFSTLLNQDGPQYQLLYGIEYQAHATSQIINAVLHQRPLLRAWAEGWEYSWIIGWGLFGIAVGLMLQSPWKTLLSLTVSTIILYFLSLGVMVIGWWIPLVPALLSLWMAGLTTSLFDRDSRVLLEQRSLTLKRTYDAVHNGPLQTLAALLRSLDDTAAPMRSQLESLNQELRSVYESMKQELLSGESHYLTTPMPELLYRIYEETLQRDLPGFTSIKILIPPNFNSLTECHLTAEQKQGLCLFLQEALCNVGNHAVGVSRLDVVCTRQADQWCLQVIDNGTTQLNAQDSRPGRGTEQAQELARSLRGRFDRRYRSPQGVVSELTWKNSSSLLQSLSNLFQADCVSQNRFN